MHLTVEEVDKEFLMDREGWATGYTIQGGVTHDHTTLSLEGVQGILDPKLQRRALLGRLLVHGLSPGGQSVKLSCRTVIKLVDHGLGGDK